MRNGMQQIKIKKCVCKNATVSGQQWVVFPARKEHNLWKFCFIHHTPGTKCQIHPTFALWVWSHLTAYLHTWSYHTYLALSPSLPSHTPIHLFIYVPWMYSRPRYFVGKRMKKRILQKTLPRYRETLFSYLNISNHFPSALWNVMWYGAIYHHSVRSTKYKSLISAGPDFLLLH